MKNLKKLLAVVLVVAMILSVGVIGASAAFTDTKDSKYGEAIDVLSGIGVIDGMTSTTYDPTGSLTREQAAKIIAYMLLGPTNAKLIGNATSQRFSDVKTTRWSAGYIEYCANVGIIGGLGDGTFDPEGVLTTAAFTKMLLCALGYNADVEGFTGNSWAIKTASAALTAGVYDADITISASTACNREQAAQLAFKALTARTVQYTGGTTITIGDSTITTGASRDYVEGSTAANANYDGDDGDGYMQFCERYFPGLKFDATTSDDFGRAQTKWTLGTKVLTTTVAPATLTYTTEVKTGKIYTDLGKVAVDVADVTVMVDGQAGTAKAIAADGTDAFGGNGALTQVYYNAAANTAKIVVVNTYFDFVEAVTENADGDKVVTVDSLNFVVDGFEPGDPVLYTKADGVVQSVTAATSVNAKLTSYTGTTAFVAGGTTYKYSAMVETKASAYVAGAGNLGDEVTIYFDNYGNAIDMQAYVAAASADYAYVVATAKSGFVYQARIVLADGTVKVVETDADYTSTGTDMTGKIATFTVTNGLYKLTDTSAAAPSVTDFELTKGISKFEVNATPYYANSNTIFLVASGTPLAYQAYTGISNVPSMTEDTSTVVKVVATSSVASFVYIENAATSPTTTAANYIFVVGQTTPTVTTDLVKGDYATFNAVVNGEVTTIDVVDTVAATLTTDAFYASVTYDANGVATALDSSLASGATAISGAAIKKAANGVIGIDSAYYSYNTNTKVFNVSALGAITESSVANIKDATVSVNALTVNGVLVALFIG